MHFKLHPATRASIFVPKPGHRPAFHQLAGGYTLDDPSTFRFPDHGKTATALIRQGVLNTDHVVAAQHRQLSLNYPAARFDANAAARFGDPGVSRAFAGLLTADSRLVNPEEIVGVA